MSSNNGGGGEAVGYKKGAWSKEEDEKLRRAVHEYGSKNWVAVEKYSGLARPAKNCRLRWLNYLRPNLNKDPLTPAEENLILHLHSKYGNSWSKIASELPGRSDNDIKNFWHKRSKKCQKYQLPIYSSKTIEPKPDQEYAPNYDNTLVSPSPENHFSRTMSYPNSPTSQGRSSLLSPYQMPQSCPIKSPASNQDLAGFNMFASFRKPPILSTPNCQFRRFSRATRQLQPEHSPDSLEEMKCLGDRDKAVATKTELPSVESETNEFMHGDECDENVELLNELKEAQSRVRFLKKRLKQRRIPNNRNIKDSKKECPLSSETDAFLDRNSSRSISKGCFSDRDSKMEILLEESSNVYDGHKGFSRRRENAIGISKKAVPAMKCANKGKQLRKFEKRDHSEDGRYKQEEGTEDVAMISNEEKLHRDEDSMEFCEQKPITELFDTFQDVVNALNSHSSENDRVKYLSQCSTTEGLYGESSNLFASQGQKPPMDVFNSIHSQITGDLGGQLCYSPTAEGGIFDNSSYGFQVAENFSPQSTINGNFPETSRLHESMSLSDLLDSCYMGFSAVFEQNIPSQYIHTNCNREINIGKFNIESTSSYTLEQAEQAAPYQDQNMIEGLLIENLWQEENMISPDHNILITKRLNSVLDLSTVQSIESKHRENESDGTYDPGVMMQKLDHNDQITISEELSSLLDFFSTTNQGFEDPHEFNMDLGFTMLSTSPPAITISDYM